MTIQKRTKNKISLRSLGGFFSVSAKKKTLNRLYCRLEQNEPRTCRYIFRYFFLFEPLLKTAGQLKFGRNCCTFGISGIFLPA